MAQKQEARKFQSFEVYLRKGEWLGVVIAVGAVCVLVCLFALRFNGSDPLVDLLVCCVMLGFWLVIAVLYIRMGRIRIFVEREHFTVTTGKRSASDHRYEEIVRIVQGKQRFGYYYDLYAEETMICRFCSNFTNAHFFLRVLEEKGIPITESGRDAARR